MFAVDTDRLMALQGNMTNTEFAKKLGVGRTQLWKITTGISAPGYHFLSRFKEVYPNESVDAIFFYKHRA